MIRIYLRIAIFLLAAFGGKPDAYSRGEQPQNMDSGLPNLSDRSQIQDRNIDISASALYWYTSESVDWAFTIAPAGKYEQSVYKTV